MGLSRAYPIPEYIRLIAHGRYAEAFMINWESNVFPGICRTCDRPVNRPADEAGSKKAGRHLSS